MRGEGRGWKRGGGGGWRGGYGGHNNIQESNIPNKASQTAFEKTVYVSQVSANKPLNMKTLKLFITFFLLRNHYETILTSLSSSNSLVKRPHSLKMVV